MMMMMIMMMMMMMMMSVPAVSTGCRLYGFQPTVNCNNN